jgi:hypothetical protein
MMQWIGRTALAIALVAGCEPASSPPAPEAKACGRLVAFYRSIHAPVEIVDWKSDPEAGKVRIDYRSSDGGNLQVEGVALCRFVADADGRLEASAALIDDNQLREDEIAAFNASRP